MKRSLLKCDTQAKSEKKFISYANEEVEFEIMSDISECEYFAPLNAKYLNSNNLVTVMRSSADLIIFELSTASVSFTTLKEFGFTKNPSCYNYIWWLYMSLLAGES